MIKQKKVYLNQMQHEAMSVRANKTVICAGRGTGKGLLHAAMNLSNFQQMPGSTTAFVAPNAKRAKVNTLPSMFQHWEAWGYKQGVHWAVGVQPPKRLDWGKPLIIPQQWDNVISFYNGAIGVIISQDRIGTSNSKSFDFIDIDEARFINYDRLKDETFPANRGNVGAFGHLPFHHGMLITSDQPLGKRGSWFLDYENDCRPELVQSVIELEKVRAFYQKRHDKPANTHKVRDRKRLDEIDAYLFEFRHTLTFFKRYSSLCNIDVLGAAWFKQMQRDLPPAEFAASILSEAPTFNEDGFYSSMTEEHLYQASDLHYIDSIEFSTTAPTAQTCKGDADLQQEAPLLVAFDFNNHINCMVVGQIDNDTGRLNVINSFFVKYKEKLPALVGKCCAYYEAKLNKEVLFYYDSTALGSNYAVNEQDFQWVITHEFERYGWIVTPMYIGRPMQHGEKHLLINNAFDGVNTNLIPYFNYENNPDLLIAMQNAGIYGGKKDKRREKVRESGDDLLEHRTDFTDAFDTLFIGAEKFPPIGTVLRTTSDF